MFENLKKAVKTENEKDLTSTLESIKENDNMMKYYLTDLRCKQYANGIITREQAESIATKKATKEYAKKLEEKLTKITDAENATATATASIYVEWVKSYTWGYNPHAEMYSNTGYSSGKASGCGYDKLSAAMAEALNENIGILKKVYERKNSKLAENPDISSHTACGYGAGYTALPYFEGGVGASSIIHVLENAGYSVSWHSGKHSDTFIISLNN